MRDVLRMVETEQYELENEQDTTDNKYTVIQSDHNGVLKSDRDKTCTMCCRTRRKVQGTGYWGKQVRGIQGELEIVQEIECEDVPRDFLELVKSKDKTRRKKSVLKKKINNMKNKCPLSKISESENEDKIQGDQQVQAQGDLQDDVPTTEPPPTHHHRHHLPPPPPSQKSPECIEKLRCFSSNTDWSYGPARGALRYLSVHSLRGTTLRNVGL